MHTRRLICLLLSVVIILLSTKAEAQWGRQQQEDKRSTRAFDANFSLVTNESFQAEFFPLSVRGASPDTNLQCNLTGGFKVTAMIKRRIFLIGISLTHFDNIEGNRRYQNGEEKDWYELNMERFVFSLTAALQTQYFQPSRAHDWFWTQITLKAAPDLLGRRVSIIRGSGYYGPTRTITLGKYYSHYFSVDVRITFQNPYQDRFGLFYFGFEVSHSMDKWSPKQEIASLHFQAGGYWHGAILIGIAL